MTTTVTMAADGQTISIAGRLGEVTIGPRGITVAATDGQRFVLNGQPLTLRKNG